MRERLVELHQAEVELVAGGGGVCDIFVGDRLVFSKKQEGRYPDDQDLQAIAE